MRHITQYVLFLGVLSFFPLTAFAGDPVPVGFEVTGGTGEPGSVIASTVSFDTLEPVQGWSYGLCHDGANVQFNSDPDYMGPTTGAAAQATNDGDGPDFNAIETMPVGGAGLTVGVVVSILGMDFLDPGENLEILLLEYELIGMPDMADIVTPLEFCETLGDPPVVITLVEQDSDVFGIADLAIVNSTLTIIPPPDYCLNLTCEGGVTDASLMWDICSDFDYYTLHRDGELLGLLDPMDTSFVDPGLAPGTYHYALIGVAFPEPTGTPTILVAECDVPIIPVTIDPDGIMPATGRYKGGDLITITGSGFDAAPDTTVFFGALEATDVMVMDANTLTCVTPAVDFLGSVDVLVTNSLGNATAPAGFLYGFLRGEINTDIVIDLADAVFGLEYLFIGGATPECLDALDIDDDGLLLLIDPVTLLNFLFLEGPMPAEPFTAPGLDPTDTDPFGCI